MKRLIVITNVLLMQVIMLAGPVVLTIDKGTTSAGIRPNDNIPITNVDYTNNLLTIESNTELHNVYIELSDVNNNIIYEGNVDISYTGTTIPVMTDDDEEIRIDINTQDQHLYGTIE